MLSQALATRLSIAETRRPVEDFPVAGKKTHAPRIDSKSAMRVFQSWSPNGISKD